MGDAICHIRCINICCMYIDISRRGIVKLFAFESLMGRVTVAGVALADGAQSSCEEGQPCQLLL